MIERVSTLPSTVFVSEMWFSQAATEILPSSNQFIVSHSHTQYQPTEEKMFFLSFVLQIFKIIFVYYLHLMIIERMQDHHTLVD